MHKREKIDQNLSKTLKLTNKAKKLTNIIFKHLYGEK